MKKLPLLFMLLLSLETISQQFSLLNPLVEDLDDLPPLVLKSCPPKFPGGDDAFQRFVKQTAQFPQRAFNEKIDGTLYVEAKIQPNGAIQILGLKGKLGGGCEKEALRIVEAMPCWEPALQTGEPVKCKILIPIVFKYL
jgi:periplasmic protein TonB